jgi:hypothetical protein
MDRHLASKLSLGGLLLAISLLAAACNPHGEETTATGSEYSGAFPSVDPNAASATSGEMVLAPGSDSSAVTDSAR